MKEETFEIKYNNLLKEYEDFTYIISHDFKAPLRGILNLSDWIIDDFHQQNYDEIEENLNLVKNRVERLDRMVDGLKLISRVERYDIEKSHFNLKNLINKVLLVNNTNFPNVTIEVEGEINTEIETYEEKLRFCLEEIMTNASKHSSKEDLKITLKINEIENNLVFELKSDDNSPEEYSSDKLNEFFRVFYTEKNKEKTNNIGIGLSILKKIISFVKGDLKLEYKKGSGICITICWPVN